MNPTISSGAKKSIFKKYRNIALFFSSHDYTLQRFKWLGGINVNNMSISALDRVVIISGIKSYLNQNGRELSDTTLEELNIQGITENELITDPVLRCGYNQTDSSPQCMSIEHHVIQAILTNEMTCLHIDPLVYLSELLMGQRSISEEGAKFLGRVVLRSLPL